MDALDALTEQRFPVGRVLVSLTGADEAILKIAESIRTGRPGYLCFIDSRTAHLANYDESYCHIQNRSMFTFPDGMPVVWHARRLGNEEITKVSGKDFMDKVFAVSAKHGFSHYFFGSTPEVIDRIGKNLGRMYPGLNIVGAVSPPFQPVEAFDIDGLAAELNRVRPTFFWCGLGAPKQEQLIARLQPKLQATVCAGVGLAFEYLAGTVQRAPSWMCRTGLEWVYRLAQHPQQLPRVIKPIIWMFSDPTLLATGRRAAMINSRPPRTSTISVQAGRPPAPEATKQM
ncbi:MAG: WecB/TagA/CpsF family glycosyltransferase [Chlorobiaceae bacterium]|nr:WecB/TagA/CpsF family glycosyltransferase [Chlorobiaceae bacterium]